MAAETTPRGQALEVRMAGRHRRRSDWLDRVRVVLLALTGFAGEAARLISVIRGIR
jgi:hypothetical protein